MAPITNTAKPFVGRQINDMSGYHRSNL